MAINWKVCFFSLVLLPVVRKKWFYFHCSDINTCSQGQRLPRGKDLLPTLILDFSGSSHSLGKDFSILLC